MSAVKLADFTGRALGMVATIVEKVPASGPERLTAELAGLTAVVELLADELRNLGAVAYVDLLVDRVAEAKAAAGDSAAHLCGGLRYIIEQTARELRMGGIE